MEFEKNHICISYSAQLVSSDYSIGVVNCGINFHLLLHLTFYVRCFGPLWTHSAFPFESQMFNFLSNSHATHGIGKQVTN